MISEKRGLYAGLAVLAVVVMVAVFVILAITRPDNTDNTEKAADQSAVVELVDQNGVIEHKAVSDFKNFINSAEKPVFVDFWAEWCPPCRAAAPFVESLARDYAGKAHILKVNVDQAPDLARQYQASSIPLFVVIDDGEVSDSFSGYSAALEPQLRQMLEQRIN